MKPPVFAPPLSAEALRCLEEFYGTSTKGLAWEGREKRYRAEYQAAEDESNGQSAHEHARATRPVPSLPECGERTRGLDSRERLRLIASVRTSALRLEVGSHDTLWAAEDGPGHARGDPLSGGRERLGCGTRARAGPCELPEGTAPARTPAGRRAAVNYCASSRSVEVTPTRVTFTVPIKPRGKERARSTRKGQHYTPAATVAAQKAVAWCATAARPSGWPTQARYRVRIWMFGAHANTDLDNGAKLVLDALNKGVMWADDRQVDALHVWRAGDSAHPRYEVEIEVM